MALQDTVAEQARRERAEGVEAALGLGAVEAAGADLCVERGEQMRAQGGGSQQPVPGMRGRAFGKKAQRRVRGQDEAGQKKA
ncbi:hypothetical protein V8J36_06940 [Frigidibacter sp. MR17.14]|uniref:hypothetical protein n=1 Tax=Frigidibacter sp. MR17.14 TaxID=3126509 RepID=UPI003012BBA0